MCPCGHIAARASSATSAHVYVVHARQDPTKTTTIRRRYMADIARRFKTLARRAREKLQSGSFTLQTNAALASNPALHNQFMEWLNGQIRSGLILATQGPSRGLAGGAAWQNVYLKAAYRRGVSSAAANLNSAGASVGERWIDASFNRPFHADRVALIYTKSYDQLEGITSQMSSKISATLADAMSQGLGVEATAKLLYDQVGIYSERAQMMARTEVIGAHAEASLNSYEEAGIEGVNVQSEFTTSHDNKVCPKCEALEGTVYSVEDARGVIPVHPNCRCAWLPYLGDNTASGVILQ